MTSRWTPAQRRMIDEINHEWNWCGNLGEAVCRAIDSITAETPLESVAAAVAAAWPEVTAADVAAIIRAILDPPQTPEEARQHAAALAESAHRGALVEYGGRELFAAEVVDPELTARVADQWVRSIAALASPFLHEVLWRLAAECVSAGGDDIPADVFNAACALCDAFERAVTAAVDTSAPGANPSPA